MTDFSLKGTITAVVTPFNQDLTIDFHSFENIIEHQIANGIEGIVVAGSTGESATLTEKERLALLIKAVEIANGRTKIIAGTGSNNTELSIHLTNLAKEHGADAVLLVAPYYNKPSQEGLYHHFAAIAESVDIPQIIYNVPGRSGVNINPETQIKLAEDFKNIVATKEASGDLEQMAQIMKYAPINFSLYCGDDALAVPAILLGAVGVISVLSNYAPKEFGNCIRYALNGEYNEAKKIHYKLLDLMQLNFVETNPVPVKSIMNIMGFCNDIVRLPLTPISSANKKILTKAVKTAKLTK